MEIRALSERAKKVHAKYATLNTQRYGREWTAGEIAQGFVGDVGDLMKLVMAKEGIREIEDVDRKLEHELSDCLWSILVLAEEYGVDLEKAFLRTMKELEQRLFSSVGNS